MKLCAALFVAALSCCIRGGYTQYVVTFNAKGIQGLITFTPDGNNVSIRTDLQGLSGSHNWHVHSLPIDQTVGPDLQCLSVWAGPHYDPFNANMGANYTEACNASRAACEAGDLSGKFGTLTSNSDVDVIDDTGTLFLSGPNSIVGRSVVIHRTDGTNFICGTIRAANGETPVVLQATFISPVAGSIYFRQIGTGEVQIWGKVYWVNDMDSTTNHNWHIHQNAPGETYRIGMEGCTSVIVGPHYDPTGNINNQNYSTDCSLTSPELCEIGDLTGKHSQININAVPAPRRSEAFFFTDSALNLTAGTNTVSGRSVAIHAADSGMPIIACAPLVESEDLTLMQYPPSDSFFTASQLSPFEDTVFQTRVLPQSSQSLRLSLLHAALNPTTNCRDPDQENVPTYDDIYDPFNIPEAEGTGTVDANPLGDLTSRYGNQLINNTMFTAFSVPVYGHNTSISSRSVRFYDGESRTCSAFIPMLRANNVIVAKASFNNAMGDDVNNVINGSIYFVQQDNGDGILGNTYIIVDIYYIQDNLLTAGHNWHVHQNVPEDEMRCVDVIGPHYNPFNVSLGNTDNQASQPISEFSNYRDDCSPLFPLRCESGDLSNKHGQLRIASNVDNRPTFTYVDSNLHLTGSYSIVGRSIGLHDNTPNAPLFDCGAVRRVFVSSSELVINLPTGSMGRRRTEIAEELVMGSEIEPTDVLVLSQEVSSAQTFSCVTVRARVLGPTQAEADSRAATLQAQVPTSPICDGAVATVAPVSLLLLLAASLLLAFTDYI